MHFTVSEDLCVYYSQRNYTLNLLSNISNAIFVQKVKVYLDLTGCPKISAAALVMLFAESTRARIACKDDTVFTIKFPKNFRNAAWEEAVGVSYNKYASLFDCDHTFQTVSEPDKAMVSILKLLHRSGVKLDKQDTRLFTKGVNEAMLNVINHAYSDQAEPLGGIGRRWWQACWKHKRQEQEILVYIIYDVGCGMLGSLPHEPGETTIQHMLRVMEYGVSRTQELDRGKGTRNMEEATDIRDNSLIFIGTNRAVYTKVEGKPAVVHENLLPFVGTLVEWQIFL
ncbi:hypothetical protein CGU03_03155 [Vibrio metoecus]|uniref:Uncharacterized protein n=1 Tax=Vibrio metoecus TaxID=1481663 RepID=A0A271VWF9_VIBMT|nr:hypothetical protein XV94_07040 [Vibrio metoecus]PAR22508.1 hypothetical protein CGU03_03155 [Vibrio metoecus]PAR24750.1 hypothetical protein CGU02_07955 [Vibrio metoecus]